MRHQPLGEIIAPIRDGLTRTPNKQLARISDLWVEIVGSDIADLAFPLALQCDILIVSVASPAVKFTMDQIYRQAIIDQVRDQTGKRIKDIKCVLSTAQSH